jgi:hypothetical protein
MKNTKIKTKKKFAILFDAELQTIEKIIILKAKRAHG